ncbi:hypothetical protein ISCGN_016038 [Ixodes scapularis]
MEQRKVVPPSHLMSLLATNQKEWRGEETASSAIERQNPNPEQTSSAPHAKFIFASCLHVTAFLSGTAFGTANFAGHEKYRTRRTELEDIEMMARATCNILYISEFRK